MRPIHLQELLVIQEGVPLILEIPGSPKPCGPRSQLHDIPEEGCLVRIDLLLLHQMTKLALE